MWENSRFNCNGFSYFYGKPELVFVNKNIKQIYCEPYHSLILKNNKELWWYWNNDFEQLGADNQNKIKDENIKVILCNADNRIIIKKNGKILDLELIFK